MSQDKKIKLNNFLDIVFSIAISTLIVIIFYILINTTFIKLLRQINHAQEEQIWEYIQSSFGFDENYKLEQEFVLYQQKYQEIVDSLPKELLPEHYQNIEILIMNDNQINAFAAPGAKIILTTGLLNSLKTEEGILFVIGHEIGHLVQKDHLQEFARVTSANFFSAMTGGLNPLFSDLLLIIDSSDSRDKEFDADLWGLKILMTQYGNTDGATEFFEVLISGGGEHDNKFLESISSHPSTFTRLEFIKKATQDS